MQEPPVKITGMEANKKYSGLICGKTDRTPQRAYEQLKPKENILFVYRKPIHI